MFWRRDQQRVLEVPAADLEDNRSVFQGTFQRLSHDVLSGVPAGCFGVTLQLSRGTNQFAEWLGLIFRAACGSLQDFFA